MLASRKSSRRANRVVRYKLADGTEVTKTYPPYKPKTRPSGRTVGDLLKAWESSPRWSRLAPTTRALYVTYSKYLLTIQFAQVKNVQRSQLLDLRDAVINARGNGAGVAFARTASTAFSWAVDRGWIEHSPATRLQKDIEKGHLPAWTEDEASLALANLPEHLRRAVVLALYTGQRRGDLISMPWTAYDGAKIRVTQEKTKQPLIIPAPDELRAELDAWRVDSPTMTILSNKFGKPWRTGSNLSKQLQDWLLRIDGFPKHRNIHGLRKLAATQLAQAGCTLHEIAAITGHQSLGMIQLYTRSLDQELAAEEAHKKLRKRREIVRSLQNGKKD